MKEAKVENYNGSLRQKSTKRQIFFLILWIIIFGVILFEVIKFANYTLGKEDKENMHLYNFVDGIVQSVIKRPPSITQEEKSLKLATLGNIYITPNMLNGAKEGSTYNFTSGLENVKTALNGYDTVIASLNTPVAGKNLGYSNRSTYNAPNELLDTLKELKVSVVATATSRAMDKKEDGISATIENLNGSSIAQTGISDSEERSKPYILSQNDINVGILSYATDSNVTISKNSTNMVNMLTEENLAEDIKYLNENNVDVIIAFLDTLDDELTSMVSGEQKENVDMLFESGVNIVLGTGIAVVQENYEDEIELESGKKSHVYTVYSLGDFMGGYTDTNGQASIIPTFEFKKIITKNRDGEIQNTQFTINVTNPILLWTTVDRNYNKKVYIMEDEISNFNNDKSELIASEFNDMQEEYNRIINILEQ